MQATRDSAGAPAAPPRARGGAPKYRQLAEHFMGLIRSGELAPGSQLPTFAQMHATHGASRPTVERMLQLLQAENLIERQNGNGIFVAQPATLATVNPRLGIIGLCGEGFSFSEYSPYWALLMGGAREAATRAGMQLLILDAATPDNFAKTDGVLVCDWKTEARQHAGARCPIVSLMTPVDGIGSVSADDEAGGYVATRHLLDLGHRRIGFLHSYPQALTHQRLSGYRRALLAAGVSPDPRWTRCMEGKYYWGKRFTIEAHRNIQRWLRADWRELDCTALICHNDEAALGAVQAFAEAGLRVPQDVSVVGFDSTEYCDLVTPPLTSVHIPLREIGAAGVEMLLRQLDHGPSAATHQALPIQLQTRASTMAPEHL